MNLYPHVSKTVFVLLQLSALTAAISLRAELTNASPDATQAARDLARYDKNKNGKLDPDEVATLRADEAKIASAAVATAAGPKTGEDTVQLSPFEVKEVNTGYYATSTMSGTRLNTKLEDIASSISVVTKAQMQDFAMLDINDIFAYESNTEGTGNYTAFDVDRNGMVTDQIQNNPQGANRIRGMGAANISLSGFATSGRVPIDPSNIDAVEISRGPNSSIFGLGEGSGTVNLVASTANVSRETTSAEFRFDDIGGWRTSLDLNRPIFRSKLALRVSAVYQHDEYRQKPSGFENRRLNAMLRFQPFQSTSLRAAFSSYSGVGTRANAVTPRDAVTYWKTLGSPAWDPIASSVTVNGVTTVLGATNPAGLGNQNFAQPILYVDNGIQLWQIGRKPAATATNGPNNTAGNDRMLESIAEPVRTGRPLFSTLAGVSSKSVYDYSSINLGGNNTIKDVVATSTVELEQFLLNTEHNRLAVQFAWQREDADRTARNIIGQASATSASYYLYIDPNLKLLDGRTNPYFGRPYIGAGEPPTSENPSQRDGYRGQGAYILDFSNDTGWTKWIGRQQVLGYYEERKTKSFTRRFRDVNVLDNPIYAPAGQPKANQSGTVAPISTRPYYHFYVGDNQGQNVDYGASQYNLGRYTFNWFDPLANGGAGTWVADPAILGHSAVSEGTSSRLNLIKTKGAMLQSNLFQDRAVFTFGKREDENRDKNGAPTRLTADGWHYDEALMNGWRGDWALRSGKTNTSGVVVKPFRGWSFVERQRSSSGARRWFGELLSGLTGYYNKSDSFRPETPAISITLKDLPNPSSVGKDYGITINLGNKFVLRANKYETSQINSRAGQSAVLATRAGRMDFQNFGGNSDAISLERQARAWLNPDGTLTAAQITTAVANVMKLPEGYFTALTANGITVTETSDVKAQGNEYELSFNPTNNLTLRANLTRSVSMDANLSPNIPEWLAFRLPTWETIIDPRTGTKWLDTGYNGDVPQAGSGTPRAFLTGNVINPLRLAQVTEGKSRPQVREWHFNLNTSYRLAGMFENVHLKRMSVGGAVRWEDKGAIGYYGVPVNGDITQATELDPNRPIWDKSHAYFDGFATYTTRLFRDKIRARFQLNVKNIQESKAHLQGVGAYPNGQPHTFRVIDPRTFIFTTTFDL